MRPRCGRGNGGCLRGRFHACGLRRRRCSCRFRRRDGICGLRRVAGIRNRIEGRDDDLRCRRLLHGADFLHAVRLGIDQQRDLFQHAVVLLVGIEEGLCAFAEFRILGIFGIAVGERGGELVVAGLVPLADKVCEQLLFAGDELVLRAADPAVVGAGHGGVGAPAFQRADHQHRLQVAHARGFIFLRFPAGSGHGGGNRAGQSKRRHQICEHAHELNAPWDRCRAPVNG